MRPSAENQSVLLFSPVQEQNCLSSSSSGARTTLIAQRSAQLSISDVGLEAAISAQGGGRRKTTRQKSCEAPHRKNEKCRNPSHFSCQSGTIL
jgi:hypothetical protein